MQVNKSGFNESLDLSIILKRVPGFIYWKDLNSVYLGCNDNLAHASGLNSPDEIIGKTDYDFKWGNAEADKFVEDDQYVISSGNIHFSEYTLPIFNNNGLFMTVLTEKSPLFDKNGKIIGVLAIAIDITDRKEAERLKYKKEIEQIKYSNAIEFQRIVAQGIHDIRSPVDAILMTIKTCTDIPEDTRLVLREASNRVQDIAEYLLNKCKKIIFKTLPVDEKIEPVIVSATLSQVLSEKRHQYQELPIEFKYNIIQKSYFSVIKIAQIHFKRMISNLLNNAVEAIDDKGKVTLNLNVKDGLVTIKIQDTGQGMAPGLVKSIMNNGEFTRGKQKGRGIGLTQVRDTLKKYNGQLLVNSRMGSGTQIILTLPESDPPTWLAKEIEIKSEDTVIILDDDPSIHSAWDIRFKATAPHVSLKHFYLGEETISYIHSLQNEEKKKILLLADYELLKQKYNGLQVILLTKMNRAILVTNFTYTELTNEALNIGVKVLPKSLASEVLISVQK